MVHWVIGEWICVDSGMMVEGGGGNPNTAKIHHGYTYLRFDSEAVGSVGKMVGISCRDTVRKGGVQCEYHVKDYYDLTVQKISATEVDISAHWTNKDVILANTCNQPQGAGVSYASKLTRIDDDNIIFGPGARFLRVVL